MSSPTLRLRPGTLLVSKTVVTTNEKPDAMVILPSSSYQLPTRGFCHLHEPTRRFGEDLTGLQVLIVKYSGRPFTLGGKEFWVIPESAVLAIIEEGD